MDHPVRMFPVPNDTDEWASLVDLCDCVGAQNPTAAAQTIPEQSRQVIYTNSGNAGSPKLTVVEPVAALGFLLRSRAGASDGIIGQLCRRFAPQIFGAEPKPPSPPVLPAPTREDFDRAVADTVQHIIDRHPPNEQPALRDYITVCGHRLNLLPHPHDRVFRYRASEVLALLDLDGNTNPKPRCTKEAQGILRDIAADSRKPDRISLEPWEVATLISRVFCDRRHSIMSHFGIDVGVYSNAKRGCEALIPRLTFSRPDFTAPSSVQEALSTGAAIEVTFPRRADT